MATNHPTPAEGMFMHSDLGTSFRCLCGWTSERFATRGEAENAAIAHAVNIDHPPRGR